ncbi:hypothetical protein A9168_02285 [Macellibacteroides sp. HH-ZS]|nr:hypothetical protein A9168_02285 [Macellibacteroides sp. HH-ZS]
MGHSKIYNLLRAGIYIFLILLTSCSDQKTNHPSTDPLGSQLRQALDSLSRNRDYTFTQLHHSLTHANDSITYYTVLNAYAQAYFNIHNFDSAYHLSNKILTYCNNQPPSEPIYRLKSAANNYLGNYFIQEGRLDSSILHYQKALEYTYQAENKEKLPDLYINLADAYIHISDYAMGAACYRKALQVSDSLKQNDTAEFPIYFGLGQVYMELRDFETSDTYFKLAEKQFGNRTLPEQFTFSNNRGDYYYYKKEYANALIWFKKALALIDNKGYDFYTNLSRLNLGDTYHNLDQPDSAHYYLNKCQPYFTAISNPTALYYIATIRAGLALKANNPGLAMQYLAQTENNSQIDLNIVTIRNKYLQEYYYKTGQYQKAYQFMSKNQQIDDSIRSDRAIKRAVEIDMRYKQDTTLLKKEIIITEQASVVKSLTNTLIAFTLVIIIFLLITVSINCHIKRQHDIRHLVAQNQLIRLRMENIRNRLSPHFLLNLLNQEIQTVKPENQRNKLYLFARLLRRNIEILEQSRITLTEELDFVDNFIQLEQPTLGDGFEYTIEKEAPLNPDQLFVPPMLIQIPVENAIKHGLRSKSGVKKLTIGIKTKNEGIQITVNDNGTGYNSGITSSTKGTGTGNKTIYQTIELLNSKNKEKIEISIVNKETLKSEGTLVTIYIPNNYSFNYE